VRERKKHNKVEGEGRLLLPAPPSLLKAPPNFQKFQHCPLVRNVYLG